MCGFIKLHKHTDTPIYVNVNHILCISEDVRLIPGTADEWVDSASIRIATLHDKQHSLRVTETVSEVLDRIWKEERE